MEATSRWIAEERERLVSRGAPVDVVVSPPAFDATRTIATQVIGENRPAVMLGDEVIRVRSRRRGRCWRRGARVARGAAGE